MTMACSRAVNAATAAQQRFVFLLNPSLRFGPVYLYTRNKHRKRSVG